VEQQWRKLLDMQQPIVRLRERVHLYLPDHLLRLRYERLQRRGYLHQQLYVYHSSALLT
jgi:hypothetical protein